MRKKPEPQTSTAEWVGKNYLRIKADFEKDLLCQHMATRAPATLARGLLRPLVRQHGFHLVRKDAIRALFSIQTRRRTHGSHEEACELRGRRKSKKCRDLLDGV